MSWLIYALLSAVCATIYALMSRVLSVKSDNPRAFSIIFGVSSTAFSLLLLTIEPFSLKSVSLPIILLTIINTIMYGIHDRTQFYASKHVEASLLSIIARLTPVFGFLTAIFFLREHVTILKLFAVIFIVVGNILVVYKNKKITLGSGLIFALISTISVGIAFALDKKASAAYSLPLYSAIVYFIPSVYNYLFPLLPTKTLKRELDLATWKITALAGINVLSFYFILKAFQTADASKVIPVSSADAIFTVLLGIVILKEKSDIKKKIFAALCVFIGIVLIGI